jgi:signal peptidase
MSEDRPDEDTGNSDKSDAEAFRRHWEQLEGSLGPPDADPKSREKFSAKFRYAQTELLRWLRIGIVFLLVVSVLGGILYTATGSWPVIVGVESRSMDPNILKGDLVILTDPARFAPAAADTSIGLVTYRVGRERGYRSLGSYGSVIVFRKPDASSSAVIHRVRFQVEAGENWVLHADDAHIQSAKCQDLQYCPAPHDGFITKGDANPYYDQASGIAPPVRAKWVVGVARVRIPLGSVTA